VVHRKSISVYHTYLCKIKQHWLTHGDPTERPKEREQAAKSSSADGIPTSSHDARYARHFITNCFTLTQRISHTHYSLKNISLQLRQYLSLSIPENVLLCFL